MLWVVCHARLSGDGSCLCDLLCELSELNEEGPMEVVPKQEDLTPHEVATIEVELETPQHHLYHALMRDYEEDALRLEDDFDDLDDYLDGDHSNVDE
jgi:hypothetical protein